jgi:hypothetical protein
MRAIVPVSFVWLTGCVLYDDTTRVRFRDTAAAIATIRPDAPAYGDAWLGSDEPGTLDVWCPSCVTIKRETPVANNELVLDGTPAQLVTLDGERVHVRFDFFDKFGRYDSYGRCRSRPCIHHVLAVDFDSPRSNVETIRYEHRVSPRNGGPSTLGLVTSIAFAVAGAMLGSVGVYLHERGERGVGLSIGSGVGMIVVGGALTGLELHERNAVGTITTLQP